MPDHALSCFIVGEGTLLVQCARQLAGANVAILGVVSRDRGVVAWAGTAGVPVLNPDSDWQGHVCAARFDYLFSIVNLELLPAHVLAAPSRMTINFHDGPLPRFAGINAPAWAILEGATSYGVTWHEVVAEADRGGIIVQRTFDIAPDETAFSLNAKCFDAGMESFGDVVAQISAGAVAPAPQDLRERSYFAKARRPDAASFLDLSGTATAIVRFVAAHDYGQGYPNPLALPKVRAGGRLLFVGAAAAGPGAASAAPGTVVSVDADGLTVATGDGDVRLTRLRCHLGTEISGATLSAWGVHAGVGLDAIDREAATAAVRRGARHERHWIDVLSDLAPVELPGSGSSTGVASLHCAVEAPSLRRRGAIVAAFLARVSGHDRFSLALTHPELAAAGPAAHARVPVTVSVDATRSASDALDALDAALATAVASGPVLRDLFLRQPGLAAVARDERGVTLPITFVFGATDVIPPSGQAVFSFDDAAGVSLLYDRARLSSDAAEALVKQLEVFAVSVTTAGTLGAAHLISDPDRAALLESLSGPVLELDGTVTVGSLFADQARRTPGAPALTFEGVTWTYAEVAVRVHRLARHLRALGVRPDGLVGVFMERSAEMVIGALAVMEAGGAYVPLDPEYPGDRIAFMLEDADVGVVLVQERVRERLPATSATVVSVDGDAAVIEGRDSAALAPRARGSDLAYVIYTSGSTGRPKGVMVEHRNVVNFFAGMDDRLGFAPGSVPGVWLAVTSLNFDISVLELFWSLTRGFHVVVHRDDRDALGFTPRHADRRMEFGAFYFSSDESEGLVDKYQLLVEGAKFADRNGFNSVWTPERHFHAFGGLFPNPSVTSAALATITQNVDLRSGSCVSPLHSVLRIAEEWSVVDNLSKGRIGLSFASGWQPNDFVIRPEAFEDRRNQMFRDIETLRRLWAGEAVSFPNGEGRPVDVRIMPRPYSPAVPIWVTAAGNPATFREAGEVGANLLTHLLGQTFDELAEKIAVYRDAWARSGRPGRGIVSLMLHTYVGPSDEAAREVVRGPMKAYLKSAVGLVKSAAWSFPTFKKTTTMEDGTFSIDHLSAEDMDAVLQHAFERYYDSAGLFGSVATCVELVDRVKGLDVDEIPCLIDFGVPTPVVLESLPRLAEVVRRANQFVGVHGSDRDFSISALLRRHGVTHFQCTPSMVAMLVTDDETRSALAGLQRFLVGGEAFPAPLARQIEALVAGEVLNMYGPTETTVWSSTHRVSATDDTVPIGRPIANTSIVIVDRQGGLLPPGALGELCIGGLGVVRGYLNRPELTRERFVADTIGGATGARLYRTGDLARVRPGGVLEFHGRLDHQVKVRGYRIELGEIEARLLEHASVRAAAAIVREDVPGDKRIVAYVLRGATDPDPDALRAFVGERLPDYMVPSAVVVLERFPETPNRKIDRKALPAPETGAAPSEVRPFVAPSGDLEETIAGIWCEVLALPRVGTQDNFFDLGGHSLLTIQVHARLKETLERPLSLVDLFRYPTVASLARHLQGDDDGASLADATERAAGRRDALARRRALRAR